MKIDARLAPSFHRRHALWALAGAGLAPLAAQAQFRVDISGVGATQVPIAVAAFAGEAGAPQQPGSIISADLARSGLFKLLDAPTGMTETSQPPLPALRSAGADALVVGSVARQADGRFDVRFKLWDVVRGAELAGQSLVVAPADLRMAAHRIADLIHEKLTGERGAFATRIAYVTAARGTHTLRVADSDGEGGQVALTSREPIISPAWSPDGRELAYVSFETRKAVVWAQNVVTGARRQIANFRGSNSAPAWSPSGSELAVTLSRQGGSQIYLIGRQGGEPRRVTQSSAIDTEATFAPDGHTLYFVSDRGGSPQIYRQSLGGGGASRVSFSGNYCISPAVSPDGKLLAYVVRSGGTFRVVLQDTAGGEARVISDTVHDESPSFAPNSKWLIYATRSGGREVLMTSSVDGRVKNTLLTSGLDIREPAWGPYL